MDTFREIQRIIAANVGAPLTSIKLESKATDFPGWDSLRHLIIIMEIEQTLGFKFDLEEVARLESVEEIVRAADGKTGDRIG